MLIERSALVLPLHMATRYDSYTKNYRKSQYSCIQVEVRPEVGFIIGHAILLTVIIIKQFAQSWRERGFSLTCYNVHR